MSAELDAALDRGAHDALDQFLAGVFNGGVRAGEQEAKDLDGAGTVLNPYDYQRELRARGDS